MIIHTYIQSTTIEDFIKLTRMTCDAISEGKVIGWFQGKMEWGPRALGNVRLPGINIEETRNPRMLRAMQPTRFALLKQQLPADIQPGVDSG